MSPAADPEDFPVPVDPASNAAVVAGLLRDGWAEVRHYLPEPLVGALARELALAHACGAMQPAAVGRGTARQHLAEIRGDRILWLDSTGASVATREFLQRMEVLRLAINRSLWLGLFDFEAHFACYPPGAHYARHRDQHRDSDRRQLTVTAYLNPGWKPGDGGALRLYVDGDACHDVLPAAGTLVAFLSERYEHEVLPARRARWSVTGWFRRRA